MTASTEPSTATETKTTKVKRRRERGTGSVYQRGDSKVWWLRYKNLDGSIVQESSGTTDDQKAKAMLKAKVARVEVGQYVTPKAEAVKVREMVEDSLTEAESNGNANVKHDRGLWERHLKPAFGHLPALATGLLNGTLLRQYKVEKLRSMKAASVNRHFAILRVAYNRASNRLGGQQPNWESVWSPEMPNPERLVSISDEQLTKLRDAANQHGLWMRALLELACNFGWRRNAWLNLKVAQVDLLNCRITLPGALSKNGEPYTANFTQGDVIYQLLVACVGGKAPDDYVLTRETKQGRQRVKSFRGTWKAITRAAGIAMKPATKGRAAGEGKLTRPGIVFHNTRNTAATRMIEQGIPQAEAMDIGGWKTDSIFRHYHITSDQAKKDAAMKMARRNPATLSLTTVLTTGKYLRGRKHPSTPAN